MTGEPKNSMHLSSRAYLRFHQLSDFINKNNHSTEMCSGYEAGSYLRLMDSCITQLKAQGPFRTCDESKEEEEAYLRCHQPSVST